ncbi:hypothetical protein MRX96_055831 [Rhipicephalus microplus]
MRLITWSRETALRVYTLYASRRNGRVAATAALRIETHRCKRRTIRLHRTGESEMQMRHVREAILRSGHSRQLGLLYRRATLSQRKPKVRD